MTVKRANVAVQVPVFTANTVRRCKMCAVLASNTHDQIHPKSATASRFVVPYLANAVPVRSRTSKNVMQMAIRTSSPAVIERDTLARACSPDIQGLDSKDKRHPYHERIFSERTDLNSVYAGSD